MLVSLLSNFMTPYTYMVMLTPKELSVTVIKSYSQNGSKKFSISEAQVKCSQEQKNPSMSWKDKREISLRF